MNTVTTDKPAAEAIQDTQGPRFAGFMRPMLGVAVVLLLIVVAVGVWLVQPPTANASAIMTHVDQVSADPGALGLHSYTGTLTGLSSTDITTASGTTRLTVTNTQQVWWLAPRNRRIEIHEVIPALTVSGQSANQEPQAVDEIMVTDGTDAWAFDPAMKHIAVIDPASLGTGGPIAGVTDLQGLLSQGYHNTPATLLGTDQVAGRSTYVLQLAPQSGPGSSGPDGSWKIWVDREFYLVLRYEVQDSHGHVRTFSFSSLQLNPPLDSSLFTFTPPPGAEITWPPGVPGAPPTATLVPSYPPPAVTAPIPVQTR